MIKEREAHEHKKYRYVFTSQEDQILESCVNKYGPDDWDRIAPHIPGRTPRQCRDRWFTYLSPEVNRTPWTSEEDGLLFDLLKTHGRKWGTIVGFFKSRTQNNVKNRWNTVVRKARALNWDPSDRKQFIEAGKKIASRSTRASFESKEVQPAPPDPQQLFSIHSLLNPRKP